MINKLRVLSIITLFWAGIAACTKDKPAGEEKPAGPTLYELVKADTAEFSILYTMLTKTRLSDTLSHFSDTVHKTGMYTLFAPTDSAFYHAGITKDSVARMRLGPMALMAKYFITMGSYPAASIPDGAELQVLQMGAAFDQKHLNRYAYLTHHVPNDTFYINGAPILQHDIFAANGVLHKIGGFVEHSSYDIATTLSVDPRFAYLTQLGATWYSDAWLSANDTTPKTIFFPTMAALQAAPSLFVYGNIQTCPNMVLFYPDFFDLNQRYVPSLYTGPYSQPANFRFLLTPEPAILNPQGYGKPANIFRTPTIVTTNGVIHMIDQLFVFN